jgi:hypothetical protein
MSNAIDEGDRALAARPGGYGGVVGKVEERQPGTTQMIPMISRGWNVRERQKASRNVPFWLCTARILRLPIQWLS